MLALVLWDRNSESTRCTSGDVPAGGSRRPRLEFTPSFFLHGRATRLCRSLALRGIRHGGVGSGDVLGLRRGVPGQLDLQPRDVFVAPPNSCVQLLHFLKQAGAVLHDRSQLSCSGVAKVACFLVELIESSAVLQSLLLQLAAMGLLQFLNMPLLLRLELLVGELRCFALALLFPLGLLRLPHLLLRVLALRAPDLIAAAPPKLLHLRAKLGTLVYPSCLDFAHLRVHLMRLCKKRGALLGKICCLALQAMHVNLELLYRVATLSSLKLCVGQHRVRMAQLRDITFSHRCLFVKAIAPHLSNDCFTVCLLPLQFFRTCLECRSFAAALEALNSILCLVFRQLSPRFCQLRCQRGNLGFWTLWAITRRQPCAARRRREEATGGTAARTRAAR